MAQDPIFGDEASWPVRQWMFDQYQRWKPRQPDPVQRVRIVDIDEESLRVHGQWPWSRTVIVELIDAVMSRGAIALGLDIIFAEPDRQSPDRFATSYPGLDEDLRRRLLALPPSDELFADVAAGYNVVVARAGMTEREVGRGRTIPYPDMQVEGVDPRPAIPEIWPGVLTNVDTIEQAARYHGVVNRYQTHDGTVRRVPVVARVGDGYSASLALETIRAALYDETLTLVGDANGMLGVRVNDELLETDPDGSIVPYFARESRDGRRISATRLLREPEAFPADAFANQLVLVGVTGLGTVDAPPTPIAPRMDGVDLQGQVIDVLLTGMRLIRPGLAMLWEAVALVVGVALIVVLLPALRPLAGFALALALTAALPAAGFALFDRARLLLDPTFPVTGIVAVYVAMLSSMLAEGLRQRRALNEALERERLSLARLAGELDAAREIQMGILPDTRQIPDLPANVDVFAMLEPAREVGGDLYDVFMLDEHRLFFVVGDVSGKGVPASLFMAISKALCRSVAMRVGGSAAEKIAVTNDEISRENPALLFVTAVAGVVDARSGRLDYCVAGHDSPLLLRPGCEPVELESEGGPPLCALDDFPYPAEKFQLEPGDTIVLTTDGITEAMNETRELYGRERMLRCMAAAPATDSPQELVEVLYEDVKRHCGAAEASDDVTVMAIGFRAPQARSAVNDPGGAG